VKVLLPFPYDDEEDAEGKEGEDLSLSHWVNNTSEWELVWRGVGWVD